MPGTILGTWDIAVNKVNISPSPPRGGAMDKETEGKLCK